jgi:hypothetical protein
VPASSSDWFIVLSIYTISERQMSVDSIRILQFTAASIAALSDTIYIACVCVSIHSQSAHPTKCTCLTLGSSFSSNFSRRDRAVIYPPLNGLFQGLQAFFLFRWPRMPWGC